MADLKLIALDADDLSVISAHMQDAVIAVSDLAFLPREQRFAVIASRFDWIAALQDGKQDPKQLARRRAALRFERVLGAQLQAIDLKNSRGVLDLLAISFEPAEPPEGNVTLHFADGGAVRLHVECIEAEMTDLGAAWAAQSKPQHQGEDPAQASET